MATKRPILNLIAHLIAPGASQDHIMLHEALKRINDALFVEGQSPFPEVEATELNQSFLTVDTEEDLENSRQLTAGSGIELTDTGALGSLAISVPTAQTYHDITDDFTTRLLNAVTGPHGVFGWGTSATAPTTTGGVSAEVGHPGIIKLPTNQGVIPLNSLMASLTSTAGFFSPDDIFIVTFLCRTTEVLTKYTARMGLNAAAGADDPPANGIYVEELLTDTNYFLVTRSGAVQTRVDTLVARSIAAWHKFVIRRVDASTIGCSVDGAVEVFSTTNIPTADMSLWIQNKSAGTGAGLQYVDTDYVRLQITGLRA